MSTRAAERTLPWDWYVNPAVLHAWTYGLDGSLRAAPRTEREPCFDHAELGLVGVVVEAWGPLVFVNPDPAAAPLADHLGELPALLEQGGIDVARPAPPRVGTADRVVPRPHRGRPC